MNDRIIFFGLPDFVLLSLAVVLAAGLVGWALSHRRRKALLAELLNGLTHGAVVVRADGRVFLVNAEARQLWGNGTFPAKLEGPWATLIGEVWRRGSQSVCDLDALSGLRLRVRAAPLTSKLILLILEDTSAQRQQETFYRNFISNVSHELKTPLTVIQGHMAAMGSGPTDDDRWPTARRIVTEEAARLTQLVDNLLLLSRLEMPDFVLDGRPVNLEAVVEDAMLQLSDLADAQGISLSLQSEGGLPRIVGDRARLKQVFLNLLDNAVKYNRPDGAVTVQLSATQEHVVARVADTGEGIPPQDLPHVFEKMYRVERRQGHPVEGSGLGLSIARHIIELHGGSVAVESQLGEGSTFTVTLPLATGDDAREGP